MINHIFAALGTVWKISLDAEIGPQQQVDLWQLIEKETTQFDLQFSRFKEGSEVTSFRTASAGTYSISKQFAELLVVADKLRSLTKGAYDPAIGGLLEAAGYGQGYKLKPDEQKLKDWVLPTWQLDPDHQKITISGPVVFDLGGMGKGYWIDQISSLILQANIPHYLVEGGGDMMATTKVDDQGWRVALEWPGKRDIALGIVVLKNQGLAASDTFKRHWGDWHHLVNGAVKQPIQHLLGCVTVAPSAWQADQLTSGLSLSEPSRYGEIAGQIGGDYVVLLKDGQAHVSPSWPGDLF